MASNKSSRAVIPVVVALLALLGGGWWWKHRKPAELQLPKFTAAVGSVRAPLPYRIVSFHKGRADKNLIRMAAQLGFNGVQFQIEGSNEGGINDFAARDAQEHLVDYCHSLNMKVTCWVHEFSDLPPPNSPNYLGAPTIENQELWNMLDKRYEWILGTAIPNVDGLALTVVETQVRATSTPMLLKLVDLVDKKCEKYRKQLIMRTFVWHPEELTGVMGAVKQMSSDVVIMSKAVPQDWQMRGGDAMEIGGVEGHDQIEEFDAAGEYFLRDSVANGMADLLAKQLQHAMSVTNPIKGICVRVDRDDYNVLFQPQEVNMWALGLLSAGAASDADDVWNKWATAHYGDKAAAGVVQAMRPTGDVVAEMLSVGNFTDGDTRVVPPAMPDDPFLDKNWQNWQWDSKFVPEYQKANVGDPQFYSEVMAQKQKALDAAKKCVADLETVKGQMDAQEYDILHTKLVSNLVELQFRTAVVQATLHFRQLTQSTTNAQADGVLVLYRKDVAAVRALAEEVGKYPPAQEFDLHGRHWKVGPPLVLTRDVLMKWADDAERMLDFYW